jgi:hypothetical protein
LTTAGNVVGGKLAIVIRRIIRLVAEFGVIHRAQGETGNRYNLDGEMGNQQNLDGEI